MEDKILKELANIAIVRQHVNFVVNNGDRKNVSANKINAMQKASNALDAKFIELLCNTFNVQPVIQTGPITVSDDELDQDALKKLAENRVEEYAPYKRAPRTSIDYDEVPKREPKTERPKIGKPATKKAK